jgi:hypothetical protein
MIVYFASIVNFLKVAKKMGCKKCGSEYVVNKTHNLCDDCNYIRIHGKSRFEVAMEKRISNVAKKFSIPAAHRIILVKTPLKRQSKRIQPVNKDRAVERRKHDEITYFEVFSNKLNECEECGATLPEEFHDEEGNINCIGQYSHILSKGAHPEFRNNAKNFNRLCPYPCHNKWEFGDRESMKIFKKNLITVMELYGSTSEVSS